MNTCGPACRAIARTRARERAQRRYRAKTEVRDSRKRAARRFRRKRRSFLRDFGRTSMGHTDPEEAIESIEKPGESKKKSPKPVDPDSERSCNVPKVEFPTVRCARCGDVFEAWVVQGRWTDARRAQFFKQRKEVPP